MKRIFIVLFLLSFIGGLVTLRSVNQAEATFTPKTYVCHCQSKECQTLYISIPSAIAHVLQHDDDYYGICKEVEPTPTVTPTPTEEVTPTPTEEVEVKVTPTLEQPKTEYVASNKAGEAPRPCVDTRPSRVANINVVQTGNKGELEVQWALPNSDKVHIEYGLEKYAQHALLNTPNDGNEVIRDLTSNEHYWFRVAGVTGCSVGEPSEWFDPLVP